MTIKITTLLGGMTFLALFVMFFNNAYADNPTENNQWDFDFSLLDTEIFQDSYDLNDIIIRSNVSFDGTETLGTVIVTAKVIQPDGTEFTLRDRLHDLENGEIGKIRMSHGVIQEGIYEIELKMTPPEPNTWHIFDSEILTFEIAEYGFERPVEVLEVETKENHTFKAKTPERIQYNELLHAVFILPENHTFEKIIIKNGEFVKHFPIDTMEIHMESNSGYNDVQIILDKQKFPIPTADAQNTERTYVEMYRVNKDLCSSVSCVNVNLDIPEESNNLLEIVATAGTITAAGVSIISLMMNRKKSKSPTLKFTKPDN